MNDADLGWYVRSRGRMLGPFQLAQLEVFKNQGRVAKFDELSRDRRNWVPAGSLPELFPRPPPPAPGTGPSRGVGAAQPHDAGNAVTGVDTSTEADTAVWFYVSGAGQTGPIPLSEMVHLARSGVLRAETFVWNSGMTDWLPARDVPALGLNSASVAASPAAATASGGHVLALSGLVLGVLGLLFRSMAFLTSAFLSGAEQNRDLLAMIFMALVGFWGLSSLLAVILGPLGMVRASRAGPGRPGFALGMAGMVLGIVGMLGIMTLIFLAVLGVMASKGGS